MIGKNTEVWEGLDQYGKACVSEKEAGEQLNDKDNGSQRNGKESREKDGSGNIDGGNRGEINKDEQLNEKEKEDIMVYPCIICKEDVWIDGEPRRVHLQEKNIHLPSMHGKASKEG